MDIIDKSTPRADLLLPGSSQSKSRRKRNSFVNKVATEPVQSLPLLADTPLLKREKLFRQKLQVCCNIFDFDDPDQDSAGKEIKRTTLFELAEYVNSPSGQKIFQEALMPDIINMVKVNILRTLPPASEEINEEEDCMEPSWPHLQIVYEFFLRFIVSGETHPKIAKRYVDINFIRKWINLFDSEDPRERDYAKTILHRMYGKFMSYRSSVRKMIGQVFCRYVSDSERHNGIAELLEILGSIINGYAIPLKKEHVQFLEKSLIPLHKSADVESYITQLSYCICQYVEKDPSTTSIIIKGLTKYWPWENSTKQILFMNELEEILELCPTISDNLQGTQKILYKTLAHCIESIHFQVAERAMLLCTSDTVTNHLLSEKKLHEFLPVLYLPLQATENHWNPTIVTLGKSILSMYEEMNAIVYKRVSEEQKSVAAKELVDKETRKQRWKELEEQALSKNLDY